MKHFEELKFHLAELCRIIGTIEEESQFKGKLLPTIASTEKAPPIGEAKKGA